MESITSPPVIFALPRDQVFPAVPAVMLNLDLEVTGTDPVLGIAWGVRSAPRTFTKFIAVYVQPTPDGQTAVTVQVQRYPDTFGAPNDEDSRGVFLGLKAALYGGTAAAPQHPPH